MCTRVFNNTTSKYPVIFRNMDWPKLVNTHLFYCVPNLFKQGYDKNYIYSQRALKLGIEPFIWHSKYRSVVIYFGDDERGFAAADGLNEKGLSVSVVYDKKARVKFEKSNVNCKAISPLRWGQHILDCYSSVDDVLQSLRYKQYIIVPDRVPDNQLPNKLLQAKATFKICISDSFGGSVIIRYSNGEYSFIDDETSLLVTDQGEDRQVRIQHELNSLSEQPSYEDAFLKTKALALFCSLSKRNSQLMNLLSTTTTSTLYSLPLKGEYRFIDFESNVELLVSLSDLMSLTECSYFQLVKTPGNQIDLNKLSESHVVSKFRSKIDPFSC